MRRETGLAGLALALALLSGCLAKPMQFFPVLDDGTCRSPPGPFRPLPLPATRALAARGSELYTLGADGTIRVSALDGGGARALVEGVKVPVTESAWLGVDDGHVHVVTATGPVARGRVFTLARVPRSGGKLEAGFTAETVIDLAVDRTGVLLLTDRGLWQIDRARWGQGRLLLEGAFASMAVEDQHVYLRALEDTMDAMPGLARLVLDDNECREPRSHRILQLDRRTAVAELFHRAEQELQGPLRLDGQALYTAAANRTGGQCQTRTLLKIPRNGGPVVAQELGGGLGGDLAVNQTSIVWIDRYSRRVFRVPPVETGRPAAVVGLLPCGASRMALLAGRIAVFGGEPESCPILAAAEPSAHARVMAFLPGTRLHLLATDQDSAYVTIDGQLSRVSLGDGRRDEIRSGGEVVMADEAAAIGQALFITDGQRLARWSRSDGIYVLRPGSARELTAQREQLYFAAGDQLFSLAPGAPAPLAVTQAAINSMDSAGDALVWSSGGGRNASTMPGLWRMAPHGRPSFLGGVEGLELVAAHAGQVYYSIGARRRPLTTEFTPTASAVFRHGSVSMKLADDQDGVRDLTAGRDGVYWRQRQGLRWADRAGRLRAIDCVNAFDATGIVAAEGRIYWTDGRAGALLAYPADIVSGSPVNAKSGAGPTNRP